MGHSSILCLSVLALCCCGPRKVPPAPAAATTAPTTPPRDAPPATSDEQPHIVAGYDTPPGFLESGDSETPHVVMSDSLPPGFMDPDGLDGPTTVAVNDPPPGFLQPERLEQAEDAPELELPPGFFGTEEPALPPRLARRAAPALDPDRVRQLSYLPFYLPPAEWLAMPAGLDALLMEDHEYPRVILTLAFRVGDLADPSDKRGLATVTMEMLTQGVGRMSARQMAERLNALDASINPVGGRDGVSIHVSCPRENLGPTLDVLTQMLTDPLFDDATWERIRQDRSEDLSAQFMDPSTLSAQVFDRLMYGSGGPTQAVTRTSLRNITTADMRAWHERFLVPENALLAVAGDISADDLAPLVADHFALWKRVGEAPTTVADYRQPTETTLHIIDQVGLQRSMIWAGRFTVPRDAPDYFPLLLANEALGGWGNSRIKLTEDDDSFKDRAWSFLSYSYAPALWFVHAEVRDFNTSPAVHRILNQLQLARERQPLGSDELEHARDRLMQSFEGRFSNPHTALQERIEIWRYDLPTEWLEAWPEHLRAVTLEQANQALRQHLDPAALTFLVVGDTERLGNDLFCMDLPVVELDRRGLPLQLPRPRPCP